MQIFSLLADTLAEIQEQIGGNDDDCDEVSTPHLLSLKNPYLNANFTMIQGSRCILFSG